MDKKSEHRIIKLLTTLNDKLRQTKLKHRLTYSRADPVLNATTTSHDGDHFESVCKNKLLGDTDSGIQLKEPHYDQAHHAVCNKQDRKSPGSPTIFISEKAATTDETDTITMEQCRVVLSLDSMNHNDSVQDIRFKAPSFNSCASPLRTRNRQKSKDSISLSYAIDTKSERSSFNQIKDTSSNHTSCALPISNPLLRSLNVPNWPGDKDDTTVTSVTHDRRITRGQKVSVPETSQLDSVQSIYSRESQNPEIKIVEKRLKATASIPMVHNSMPHPEASRLSEATHIDEQRSMLLSPLQLEETDDSGRLFGIVTQLWLQQLIAQLKQINKLCHSAPEKNYGLNDPSPVFHVKNIQRDSPCPLTRQKCAQDRVTGNRIQTARSGKYSANQNKIESVRNARTKSDVADFIPTELVGQMNKTKLRNERDSSQMLRRYSPLMLSCPSRKYGKNDDIEKVRPQSAEPCIRKQTNNRPRILLTDPSGRMRQMTRSRTSSSNSRTDFQGRKVPCKPPWR